MDLICEQALKSGRYAIIFDKTARAEIYFNYKATMKEFYKDILGVHMQVHDRRQATENIRHSLVYSMRSGDRLVILKNPEKFEMHDNFMLIILATF